MRLENDVLCDIAALKKSGCSLGVIADRLGVSKSTAFKYCEPGALLRAEQANLRDGLMSRLIAGGVSSQEIADLLGVSYSTVQRRRNASRVGCFNVPVVRLGEWGFTQ